MSADHMQRLVTRYLTHRRQLGYELVSSGILLRSFARFADRVAPAQPLTLDLGYRWALALTPLTPRYREVRLSALRGLARYAVLFDSRTEVMPKGQFGSSARHRPKPHIYTLAQVRWLMRDAALLEPSWSPLRALTMRTVIGLLWCTGLRIGAAVRLLDRDLDVKAATLRIAPHKFSPERIIPIHSSVVRALQRYQRTRLKLYPRSQHLFVSHSGQGGLSLRTTIEFYFRWLASPLRPKGSLKSVRLHDFRHTFATNWIARWSRQSAPLPHHLVLLTRYLGHHKFSDTYWYVQSDRRALRHAGMTFQNYRDHSRT
ncbi:MAG: tyrosine-type recombinase/integrase [Lacunisphaera sp.]